MNTFRCALLSSALLVPTGGCVAIAVSLAPDREPQPASAATAEGDRLFAEAMLAGDYEGLPRTIEQLTRLSLENPRDGRLHLLLGMAHLWRVSEKDRLSPSSPRVTEHIVLARHYLGSARDLLPDDARVHAWNAGTILATSTLLDDQAQRRAGFFDMKKSIKRYPEFNLFSASYVFSRLPADDPKYEPEVVEPMFEALERCYGEADDWAARREALQTALATSSIPEGPERICYPSRLAPHNIEGFFLHFGDVLSKAGRPQDAVEAWQMASLAPTYDRWPNRAALEARLADPAAHASVARAGKSGEGMMITSALSCSGCHQAALQLP